MARLVLRQTAAFALLAAAAGCGTGRTAQSTSVEIEIRYSRFAPSSVEVPAGRPIRFVLRNDDPIDHEWIVGDEATHERHATGTEPRHDERPTEVSVDGLSQRLTTVTFDTAGTYRFVCHLPGHEAYGMSGVVTVSPG